jgi:hypothetical protein
MKPSLLNLENLLRKKLKKSGINLKFVSMAADASGIVKEG